MNKILLQNMNFKYQDKEIYNKPLNAVFVSNSIYLISGKNGSGKSTFVSILLKMLKGYLGFIYIDGRELSEISRREMITKIGVLPQRTPVFYDSIANNITMGRSGNIEKVCHLLFFDDDLKRTGRTIESTIKKTSDLSVGQLQKLGIMRTLYQDKDVFIFDEPTANLDRQSIQEFYRILSLWKKDRIIFLISHDIEAVNYVDKVYSLE